MLVWRKAPELVLAIYKFAAAFPKRETYGLSHQMRRGGDFHSRQPRGSFRKRSKVDKVRFLNMAEGSIEERRYYLILAQDLSYGQTETLMNSLEEVSRLLSAYARAILASGS